MDSRILNRIQQGVPLSPTPFAELAGPLGIGEGELLGRLDLLKREGIIRQISGIFDATSLGYETALVAMKISPETLPEAVSILNHHPGISHNYLRDHPFNVWFTLAVFPERVSIRDHVKVLSDSTGSDETLFLPALQLYKIGAKFSVGSSQGSAEEEIYDESRRAQRPLMPWERKIVCALQKDLPLIPRPFEQLAKEVGLSEKTILEVGERLKREGFLRRFAAVLRHRRAGFSTNVMTVWEVSSDRLDEVGEKFAQLPFVTHCYRRPVSYQWRYPLFAMIHGRSREECDRQISQMQEISGARSFLPLFSLKEFKKVRTQYFTPDQQIWEDRFLGCPEPKERLVTAAG